MKTITVGTRVLYADGTDKDGTNKDTGTIVDIILSLSPFIVVWDNPQPGDSASGDGFSGNQLLLA